MIVICNDICKILFSLDYKTIYDDERKNLVELAEHVLKDNDWNNVYSFFDSYLRNECRTENDVINYVLWFILLSSKRADRNKRRLRRNAYAFAEASFLFRREENTKE